MYVSWLHLEVYLSWAGASPLKVALRLLREEVSVILALAGESAFGVVTVFTMALMRVRTLESRVQSPYHASHIRPVTALHLFYLMPRIFSRHVTYARYKYLASSYSRQPDARVKIES